MRKYILFLLAVVAMTDIYAQQTETSHSVSVSSIAQSIKDPSVYPHTLNRNGMGIQYDFLKESNKRKTLLSLGFIRTDFLFNGNKASYNNFSMGLSDVFRFARSTDRRFKGYIGYHIDINPSFYKVSGKMPAYYSWNTANTLGLYQSYSYSWYKSNLTLDINLPLIGFVSRPNDETVYPNDVNEIMYNSYSSPQFTSWNNYKAISASLKYTEVIGKRTSFFVAMDYNYRDQHVGVPLRTQGLGIRAGISFRF